MSYETEVKAAQKIASLERRLSVLERLDRGAMFTPLKSPLTSTSFDGDDSFSTTGKTLIDLSSEFGVPAGVKAVSLTVGIKDSASETNGCLIAFSPNDIASEWAGLLKIQGLPNDVQFRQNMDIPCDSNGDIYYQIVASGVGTMDVVIEIWGYCL